MEKSTIPELSDMTFFSLRKPDNLTCITCEWTIFFCDNSVHEHNNYCFSCICGNMMSLYDQHIDTAISLVTESVVVCTIRYFVQVYYIIKQGIALKVHCKVQCKYPWALRWIMNCGWLIYNKLIYTWFLSVLYLLSIGGQSQSWCHQQQHFSSFLY